MNSPDVRALLNPHLADLEEYAPIEPFEVLSARLGIPAERIVKLDANENPYGPLPAVTEALARYPHFHVYPDPRQSMLCDALSKFIDVPAAHIVPGHGADELLDCLCRLFLAPGDTVINAPPTFGMYSFDAKLAGAKVVDVDRSEDFSVDVDGIAAAVEAHRPKLLFLTSPNNPSGNWLDDHAFERLLALPVVVVLDEAYVEFADHASRARRVLDRENLVVLRTFSKAAGIAGLRLGYGVFPDWLVHELLKFKQPYNVNVAAGVAGIASLRNAEQIEAVVQKLKAERARLYALARYASRARDGARLAGELHPVPGPRAGRRRSQARARKRRNPGPALRQARARELHPDIGGPAGAHRCAGWRVARPDLNERAQR